MERQPAEPLRVPGKCMHTVSASVPKLGGSICTRRRKCGCARAMSLAGRGRQRSRVPSDVRAAFIVRLHAQAGDIKRALALDACSTRHTHTAQRRCLAHGRSAGASCPAACAARASQSCVAVDLFEAICMPLSCGKGAGAHLDLLCTGQPPFQWPQSGDAVPVRGRDHAAVWRD